MSDQPIIVPVEGQFKGADQVLGGLAEMKKAIEAISKLDLTSELKAQLATFSTGFSEMQKGVESGFSRMAKQMVKSTKDASEETVGWVKQARAQAQKEYEELAKAVGQMGTRDLGYLLEQKQKGVQLHPDHQLMLQQALLSNQVQTASTAAANAKAQLEEKVLALQGRADRWFVEAQTKSQTSMYTGLFKEIEAKDLEAVKNHEEHLKALNARVKWAHQRVADDLAADKAGDKAFNQQRAIASLFDASVPKPQDTAAASAATKALVDKAAATKLSREEAEKLKLRNQLLAESMKDLHSAARGVASGFGAMWLTWGNIAPLMAGAAISNGIVKSVKDGAEFEQVMRTIGELSESSAAEMSKVSAEALKIGSSTQYGPLEAAKGFKTLALAGLDAKEQLAAIKPVLDFATVGEMELAKAAESITAISTAFGYNAQGYSAVGDIIAKAAAISMSSVSDMTEAFKVASVVAQQYGVTVKDAALNLAMLAQVGIRGSSAGTAMRQMYNELIGSSKQAQKVLKETLGVDIIDNQAKQVKNLQTVLKDLSTALSKYDFGSQLKILQDLGNERGTKAISAGLTAMATKAKDSGVDLATTFDALQKKLEDAPGFVAQAAIGMALTSQAQMKSIGNSLQSSLIEAFSAAQPVILQVAQQLREAFNSDGFKESVKGLIGLVADLTAFLVKNSSWLAAVAVGFATGTSALMAFNAVARIATIVLPALGAAWGVMSGTIAITSRSALTAMGPLGLALMAMAGVYWMFARDTESASEKAVKASNERFKATVEGLKEEERRLDKQMQLRREGVDSEVIANATRMQLAKDDLEATHKQVLATQRLAHERLVAQRSAMVIRTAKDQDTAGDLDEKIKESSKALMATELRQFIEEREFSDLIGRVTNKARQDAIEAEKKAKEDRKRQTGSAHYEGVTGGGTTSDNTLSNIKKQADTELSALKAGYADKEKLLKASLQSGLITQGEYYKSELDLARAAERDELAQIEKSRAAYAAEFVKKYSVEKDGQKKKNMVNTMDSVFKDMDAKERTLESAATTRKALALIELGGSTRKVAVAVSEFAESEKNLAEQLERTAATEAMVRDAKPSERAAIQAYAGEVERLTRFLGDYDKQIRDIERSIKPFTDAQESMIALDEEQTERLRGLRAWLNAVKGARDQLASSIPGKAKGAADRTKASIADDLLKQSDPFRGVTNAFDKFEQQSLRVADNIESAMTSAFQSASSELTKFVTKGAGDFASFRDSVIASLVQIYINEMLVASVKGAGGWLKGFFSSGSAGSGAVVGVDNINPSTTGVFTADGGGFTGFGARSGGIDGKGGFPAILHPNETVLDHTRGQAVSRGTVVQITNTPNIQIDSRSDAAAVYSNVAQQIADNNRVLFAQLRKVGVIA